MIYRTKDEGLFAAAGYELTIKADATVHVDVKILREQIPRLVFRSI
jgi:hypothetical protein